VGIAEEGRRETLHHHHVTTSEVLDRTVHRLDVVHRPVTMEVVEEAPGVIRITPVVVVVVVVVHLAATITAVLHLQDARAVPTAVLVRHQEGDMAEAIVEAMVVVVAGGIAAVRLGGVRYVCLICVVAFLHEYFAQIFWRKSEQSDGTSDLGSVDMLEKA
jgi:hypothetical protein